MQAIISINKELTSSVTGPSNVVIRLERISPVAERYHAALSLAIEVIEVRDRLVQGIVALLIFIPLCRHLTSFQIVCGI